MGQLAPSISVRSIGDREWSVTVRKKSTAEKVQSTFEDQGLNCGRIRNEGQRFSFQVNAHGESANEQKARNSD